MVLQESNIHSLKNSQIYQSRHQTNGAYANNSLGFRGVSSKTLDLPNDSVEISSENRTERKNKSNASKWAIGLGVTALTVVGGALAFIKFAPKAVSKFYNNKLVLSNLPEKIEFKEASSLEEAIKFAKETLCIKNIDKNFDNLYALNYINKALVDVSNIHKGKLYIPTSLKLEVLEDNTLAYMDQSIRKSFGTLAINKKFFDEQLLSKNLEELLFKKDGTNYFVITKGGNAVRTASINHIVPMLDKDTSLLVQKYYNKENLSVREKQILYSSIGNAIDLNLLPSRNPMLFFKFNNNAFEKAGIKIDFEKLRKMNGDKQLQYFKDKMDEYAKVAKRMYIKVKQYDPCNYIYHEMGHLQDYGKNLRELSAKDWKFDWSRKSKPNKKELVNDHWGSIDSDEKLAQLFKDNPNEFKEHYPSLYEFLTNDKSQQTAGRISEYAQSGIGEFIAETYAEMIRLKKEGKTLSKEIMDLYRKYNGPELP